MNETIIVEVLIVGFEDLSAYRIPLFLLLLFIYVITCIENLLIICLVWKSPHLHSPMYFLIGNLLFCELINTTDMEPSVLYNILSGRGFISFIGCLIQMHVGIAILIFETLLLMLMSYDRCLAICYPLRYSVLMHNRLCLYFVISFWLIALITVVIQFYLVFVLKYCGPISIDYFFCEYTMFFGGVTCILSDLYPLILFGLVQSALLNAPFALIVLSYTIIIVAILRIKSSDGRRKAFSTCSSHLMVVSLYFGIPFASYIWIDEMRIYPEIYDGLSFIYYFILPLLNPIIYSLRNEEIHKALKTSVSEMKAMLYD
uniref:G-protein coupled receptors family 1 profile domain-containing protein n=1 Tax=Pyxicephalus adspersus TaxID=30357 RepID=A0AAV3AIM8_PYXAD|nr:TPA: hypothetical protein GDO54_014700 [Pyxicephalus adspersus]